VALKIYILKQHGVCLPFFLHSRMQQLRKGDKARFSQDWGAALLVEFIWKIPSTSPLKGNGSSSIQHFLGHFLGG